MMTRFDVPLNTIIRVPFATYNSSGASVTMTGLVVNDIKIYKDGSLAERSDESGFDVSTDWDGITGIHMISIDTGETDSPASFWTLGSEYHVVVSSVTVDSQTINAVVAWFRLVAGENVSGYPGVDVQYVNGVITSTSTAMLGVNVVNFGGSAGTFASGRPETNTSHIAGSAVSTTAAQIGVNVVQISTDATAADNAEAFFDGTGYAGTNNVIPTVTTATNVTTVNGLAANVITAAAIATDAIGAAELAADAVAEIAAAISIPSAATIADAVWDEDATAHQTQGTFGQAIGDPVADTNTIFKAVVTDATGATVGVDGAAILAAVDTEVASVLAAVDTEVAAIKAVTDQFAFGTANRVNAQVYGVESGAITAAAIAADAIGASELAADAATEIGTAVWATAARSLTVLDEDSTTLDLDATIRSAVGLASANLDTQLDALPTNAELATSQAAADDATLAAIAALNNLSAAQVNAEVLAVMNVDTYAEPGQGNPAATASIFAKLNYLYKWARNKKTQTATVLSVYADDETTVDHKSTVSDDGTTATRGEIKTGP